MKPSSWATTHSCTSLVYECEILGIWTRKAYKENKMREGSGNCVILSPQNCLSGLDRWWRNRWPTLDWWAIWKRLLLAGSMNVSRRDWINKVYHKKLQANIILSLSYIIYKYIRVLGSWRSNFIYYFFFPLDMTHPALKKVPFRITWTRTRTTGVGHFRSMFLPPDRFFLSPSSDEKKNRWLHLTWYLATSRTH